MFRIGIDLGGTKIEGIALDPSGGELVRRRIETQQEGGYEHVLQRIRALYQHLVESIGGETHSLGIGTPGAISPRTGLMKNSNTLCLNGRRLKADLEKLLKRSVEIQNDANCFAMAEALHGAGRGRDLVFGVIMGTGCGGGIVHRQQVLTGAQAIAGEWGHMSIDPAGPLCYCGKRGCVETFISGGGAEARYAERFGRRLSFVEIAAGYRDDDADAVQFVETFLEDFGRALGNLISVLDPDVVVLGGGVSNFEPLYDKGVAQVARFVFSDYLDTPIVKHQLGDSAGVLGAALVGA